jgi:hypothetical protein
MAYRVSLLSTLAACTAALALAAPAGARDIATIDGWELNTTGKACSMTSTFSDDVMIGLIWSPRTGELSFIAAGPKWDDLRAQKTAALELTFDGDAKYAQWEDPKAAVVPNGIGKLALISTWGADHKEDLARTVAAASRVSVRVAGRDLGAYDLAGSPAAYRALMKCGNQVAKAG